MKKRIDYYDIAKGIGILLILLGHSSIIQNNSFIMNFIYLFHVPIFFIISGILFKEEKNSIKIKKMIKKIILPYIVTCIMIVLFATMYEIYKGNYDEILPTLWDWSISSILASGIKDFYGFRHIGAIWFIIAYFLANLILNSLLKLKKEYYSVPLLFFVGIISSKIYFLPFSIQPAISGMFYMYIGILIKKYDVLSKTNHILFYIFSIIIGTIVAYSFDTMVLASNYFPGGLMSIIGSITLSISLINISMYLSKNKKINVFLSFFSVKSIYIICIHTFYLDLLKTKIGVFFSNQLISLLIMILFPIVIIRLFYVFKKIIKQQECYIL